MAIFGPTKPQVTLYGVDMSGRTQSLNVDFGTTAHRNAGYQMPLPGRGRLTLSNHDGYFDILGNSNFTREMLLGRTTCTIYSGATNYCKVMRISMRRHLTLVETLFSHSHGLYPLDYADLM